MQSLDLIKAGKYAVGERMAVWFERYAKIKVRSSPTKPTRTTSTTALISTSGDDPPPGRAVPVLPVGSQREQRL